MSSIGWGDDERVVIAHDYNNVTITSAAAVTHTWVAPRIPFADHTSYAVGGVGEYHTENALWFGRRIEYTIIDDPEAMEERYDRAVEEYTQEVRRTERTRVLAPKYPAHPKQLNEDRNSRNKMMHPISHGGAGSIWKKFKSLVS